jgi:hypothetical protein
MGYRKDNLVRDYSPRRRSDVDVLVPVDEYLKRKKDEEKK